MKKALILMTLLPAYVLLVLIANSCQPESNTVKIIIGDLYFDPETIQLKADQEVKIELINEGKIEHEFMVGHGVKMEQENDDTNEEMHENNEAKQQNSEVEHGIHEKMHHEHAGISGGFKKDFFEVIKVLAQTELGAEFMEVPGHGTMVTLKPESKAILTFKVPNDRKGEWEMACFVPGHYEAKMKGKIIVK